MKYGLLLAATVAGGICAAYLMDEKRGAKRRKILKKRVNRALNEASHRWNEYSKDLKPYWDKYSSELSQGAEKLKQEGLQKTEEATQNGWHPSARMLGATASAIAFYGAGRKGMAGTLLRLASLGLFTRALMASR